MATLLRHKNKVSLSGREISVSLARRLVCELYGVDMSAFAEMIGVRLVTLQKYEAGRMRLPEERCGHIGHLLAEKFEKGRRA